MYVLPVIDDLKLTEPEKFGNVAEKLAEADRRTLAVWLIELVDLDEKSMAEWVAEAEGYLQDLEEGNTSSPQNKEQSGSDEDQEPPATELTLSAVIQFSARATDAILSEPDLAKASEPGAEPLAGWISGQLRTQDKDWEIDTDPLVIHMAVTGLAWRKRSFDDYDKAFHSNFLTIKEVVINKNIRSIARAPRITHQFERYPYEIERSIQRKHWIDYNPVFNTESDPQASKQFYEIDLYLDLDGDQIDEPWTITISRDDIPDVVRISPRWTKKTVTVTDETLDFKPFHRFFPYKMLPDPAGGFLPKGFGWLLNKIENSANRLLAAIDDTAKSESENGGVYGGQGFALPDKIELKGNRLVHIPTDGLPLQQAVQLWPAKSVSPGSVQVLEKMLTLGDKLAGVLNTLENAPASMTATLAKGVIDAGTQVQSAVHRRLVGSMTAEFRSFAFMADAYDQLPEGVQISMAGGVAVTADPQLATEMHRSALGAFYMELLKAPVVFNPKMIGMRLLQVMRIPNPQECLAPPQQAPQATPQEQAETAIAMEKEKTARLKAIADVALNLATALKTLVEASAGTVDIQTSLMQMNQLEQTVQALAGTVDARSGSTGLAGQSGNPSPNQVAPPQAGGTNGAIPPGATSGPVAAGAGGGVSPA